MPAVSESKYLVMAGWDDVPHLTEKTKRELLDSTPAHLRQARSKGIPLLGEGACFPVDDKLIECDPFPIPPYWKQIGGMDFGWDHPTAAVHLAYDADSDTVYVTRSYKQRQQPVAVHADAVKAWGLPWLPIAWPHDGDNNTAQGPAVAGQYRDKDLDMLPERATWEDGGNSVEAGVSEMLDRMVTGRWKVFKTCGGWMEEKRLYHRKDGKIVKIRDDALSASRYALMMLRFAKQPPRPSKKARPPNWRAN
jgi:hypothetical protein